MSPLRGNPKPDGLGGPDSPKPPPRDSLSLWPKNIFVRCPRCHVLRRHDEPCELCPFPHGIQPLIKSLEFAEVRLRKRAAGLYLEPYSR